MALIGNWKPSDLSDIDVNQNGVVDDWIERLLWHMLQWWVF